MPVEVKMPQMGESITEGTLVKWHKQPGDKVARDEILFEISTDKVDTEVPSPAEGYLAEVFVREGETVPVDTMVCLLSEKQQTAASREKPQSGGASRPVSASRSGGSENSAAGSTVTRSSGMKLSPAVRRLVREHQVDVTQIEGNGEGGRITQKDVQRYLKERQSRTGTTAAAAVDVDRVEPLSVMRKKIAEHMVESQRTSPHVSTVHEVDMTRLEELRLSLREEWRDRGVKPTYLPFVVQAVTAGLQQFPVVNASIVGGEVHYKGATNIGIAVALEDGLIVPVVRNAESMSILELSQSIEDLARRARRKGLNPEEVHGGTFTITNPGIFGSLIGTPIIHQPQVAILCLGAVKKRVVVLPENDAIAVRSMCYLTLTFDHRLIDGAVADQFLGAVTRTLEDTKFRTGQ